METGAESLRFEPMGRLDDRPEFSVGDVRAF
jgi:hypothetical protein